MLVECCFTSRETVGLLGTGAQDGHLDFHAAPDFCSLVLRSDRLTLNTREGDPDSWEGDGSELIWGARVGVEQEGRVVNCSANGQTSSLHYVASSVA